MPSASHSAFWMRTISARSASPAYGRMLSPGTLGAAMDSAPPCGRSRSVGWNISGSLHRLSPCHEAVVHLEARLLVQAQRTLRVVAVDAQPRARHAALAKQPQRPHDERPRQAAAPPRTPGEDRVEPAALQPERFVLSGEDAVDDAASDLVPVPGDQPQRRIPLGRLEEAAHGRLRFVRPAPMVAESLAVGSPDR